MVDSRPHGSGRNWQTAIDGPWRNSGGGAQPRGGSSPSCTKGELFWLEQRPRERGGAPAVAPQSQRKTRPIRAHPPGTGPAQPRPWLRAGWCLRGIQPGGVKPRRRRLPCAGAARGSVLSATPRRLTAAAERSFGDGLKSTSAAAAGSGVMEAASRPLVAVRLAGASRWLFASSRRLLLSRLLSPSGSHLAWLEWQQPFMPWESNYSGGQPWQARSWSQFMRSPGNQLPNPGSASLFPAAGRPRRLGGGQRPAAAWWEPERSPAPSNWRPLPGSRSAPALASRCCRWRRNSPCPSGWPGCAHRLGWATSSCGRLLRPDSAAGGDQAWPDAGIRAGGRNLASRSSCPFDDWPDSGRETAAGGRRQWPSSGRACWSSTASRRLEHRRPLSTSGDSAPPSSAPSADQPAAARFWSPATAASPPTPGTTPDLLPNPNSPCW